MIIIEENNINKVWKNALEKLYKNGYIPQDSRFFKMDTLIIEMNEPELCEPDSQFPMDKANIDIINNFIITGENEEKVCHEWTKLYFHRLFDNPNSQIEYMIKKIKKDRVGIACNIYDKLLMNLQEFITVQKYIASRCRLKTGRFTMFIDYAQISVKDKKKVEDIISK